MGQAKDLLEQNVKSWNDHRQEDWVGSFSDEARMSAPGGVAGTGPEMTKAMYSLWQDAFPDNQVQPVNMVEEGDTVAMEAVFEGTHTGPLRPPSGEIAATGKHVSVPFVVIFVHRDGRFTDLRLYFDQVELLTQLGIAPG
jgi:predicted ester cyclase